MPASPQRNLLQPSLLDRLTDDEPDVSTEPPQRSGQTVSELHKSLCRDLEALLNTRKSWHPPADEVSERARSILSYGVPELVSISADSSKAIEELQEIIKNVVIQFEPRLREVQVSLDTASTAATRALTGTIEAILPLDPLPERLTFKTRIDPSTGEYAVEAGR